MQNKPWWWGLVTIGAAFAVAGCSGGEPELSASSGAASASSSGAGGNGGAGSGQGGQGGTGGQGGQSSTGGLLPLAVGYQWTYDVKQLGVKDTCGGLDNTTVVLKATTLDGKDGFEVDYLCSMPLALRSEGDLVEFNQGNGWQTLLAPPVQDGASWTCYGTSSCTWKSAGAVTVPAGTFPDCWTASVDLMDGETRQRTYCRGVGQVTSHYQSLAGDGYDAALVSSSF